MGKYYLLRRAVDDLADIWNYTFDEWSEIQADKYYLSLLESCQQIADNHSLGKPYTEISNILFGYRSGEHIIFYVIADTDEIDIIRILHGRADLKKWFNHK